MAKMKKKMKTLSLPFAAMWMELEDLWLAKDMEEVGLSHTASRNIGS